MNRREILRKSPALIVAALLPKAAAAEPEPERLVFAHVRGSSYGGEQFVNERTGEILTAIPGDRLVLERQPASAFRPSIRGSDRFFRL